MATTRDPYAIISLGGKQYRVREGERLLVDRLKTDEGKTFNPDVLFLGGDGEGTLAPKTQVTAKVVGHVLGEKIRIGKRRPKSGYRKQTGFRAHLSQIEIQSIGGAAKRTATRRSAGGREGSSAPKAKAEPKAEPSDGRGGCSACSRAPAARVRGLHRRGHRREVEALEARAARSGAEVREEERKSKGRDRCTRIRDRREAGEAVDGSQEGTRLVAQRARLEPEDARREDLLRPGGQGRDDHRPPARNEVPPGCGTGIGRDDTIFATRPGTVAFRTSGERRFVEVNDRLASRSLEALAFRVFHDRARIQVRRGAAATAACSFRREKHVPKGGPDGGDGGPGGDVVLVADPDLRDLSAFRPKRRFKAGSGEPGRGALKHGATGEDGRAARAGRDAGARRATSS